MITGVTGFFSCFLTDVVLLLLLGGLSGDLSSLSVVVAMTGFLLPPVLLLPVLVLALGLLVGDDMGLGISLPSSSSLSEELLELDSESSLSSLLL